MMQTIENSRTRIDRQRYILYTKAEAASEGGSWHFEIYDTRGDKFLEASGVESEGSVNRIALLGTIRALESLDGPAQVILVGCSRYVSHGLRFGLPNWRQQGWLWECFGQMVPVRHCDLWQRLDRALNYHQVETIGETTKKTRPATAGLHSVDVDDAPNSYDGKKLRTSVKPQLNSMRHADRRQRRSPVRAKPSDRTEGFVDQLQLRLQTAVQSVRRVVGEMARSWLDSKRGRALLGVDR